MKAMMLLSEHTSSYGCSVYDKTTRQWFTPSNSGTCYCAAVSEDGIILGGDSSTTGLKYFDFETGQLTMIDASVLVLCL